MTCANAASNKKAQRAVASFLHVHPFSVSSLDPCVLARIVQLQKMPRPIVWSCDGNTFYKSWPTTLYFKNEAYVCGFVGMEVNKEKAFEVWHRRPDLDNGNNEDGDVSHVPVDAAMKSPTMNTEKKPAMIQKTALWHVVDKPKKAAMKSPAMKTAAKAAMQTATIMKKARKRSS
jgi:hypothetical protein